MERVGRVGHLGDRARHRRLGQLVGLHELGGYDLLLDDQGTVGVGVLHREARNDLILKHRRDRDALHLERRLLRDGQLLKESIVRLQLPHQPERLDQARRLLPLGGRRWVFQLRRIDGFC